MNDYYRNDSAEIVLQHFLYTQEIIFHLGTGSSSVSRPTCLGERHGVRAPNAYKYLFATCLAVASTYIQYQGEVRGRTFRPSTLDLRIQVYVLSSLQYYNTVQLGLWKIQVQKS